jgi:hypothetical protein
MFAERKLSLLLGVVFSVGLSADILGDWESGRSTYYTTWRDDIGHCSFGKTAVDSFPFENIVAPNTAFYDSSAACGQCYEVECTGEWTDSGNACCKDGTVIVQVTDECPAASNTEWCSGDIVHFDLSDVAFDSIAESSCGVISMRYRRVSCPFSTNVILRNANGVNKWWYAVTARDVADYGDIASLEVRDSSSNAFWMSGVRQAYNAWLFEKDGGLELDLDVRLTDSFGRTIEAMGVVTNFNGSSNSIDGTEYTFDVGDNYAITGVSGSTTGSPVSAPAPSASTSMAPTQAGGDGDGDGDGGMTTTMLGTTSTEGDRDEDSQSVRCGLVIGIIVSLCSWLVA